MLIFDMRTIGNKLLCIRKSAGLTQAEVAELADLSIRTYADIERGTVNMRIETMLRICQALHITPDEILTQSNSIISEQQEDLFERLNSCSPKNRETALNLLTIFLQSID